MHAACVTEGRVVLDDGKEMRSDCSRYVYYTRDNIWGRPQMQGWEHVGYVVIKGANTHHVECARLGSFVIFQLCSDSSAIEQLCCHVRRAHRAVQWLNVETPSTTMIPWASRAALKIQEIGGDILGQARKAIEYTQGTGWACEMVDGRKQSNREDTRTQGTLKRLEGRNFVVKYYIASVPWPLFLPCVPQ